MITGVQNLVDVEHMGFLPLSSPRRDIRKGNPLSVPDPPRGVSSTRTFNRYTLLIFRYFSVFCGGPHGGSDQGPFTRCDPTKVERVSKLWPARNRHVTPAAQAPSDTHLTRRPSGQRPVPSGPPTRRRTRLRNSHLTRGMRWSAPRHSPLPAPTHRFQPKPCALRLRPCANRTGMICSWN
jgi:hypothetical protein